MPIPALQSVLYRCCDLSWFRPPSAQADGRDVCAGVELECGLWHRSDTDKADVQRWTGCYRACCPYTVIRLPTPSTGSSETNCSARSDQSRLRASCLYLDLLLLRCSFIINSSCPACVDRSQRSICPIGLEVNGDTKSNAQSPRCMRQGASK